jgi:hypothetical protein
MIKYIVKDKDGNTVEEFTDPMEAALLATNHMDDRYEVYCNSKEKCNEWIAFKYKEDL